MWEESLYYNLNFSVALPDCVQRREKKKEEATRTFCLEIKLMKEPQTEGTLEA